MNSETLKNVIDEILPVLPGRRAGKIFQLSNHSFVFDFRPHPGKYLFISIEPSQTPRLYLVERRLRDLEKHAEAPSNFVEFIRKRLSHANLQAIEKVENERIVRFSFRGYDEETDAFQRFMLIAQLTGRTANLFFLDEKDVILASVRDSQMSGQQTGEIFQLPKAQDQIANPAKTDTGNDADFWNLNLNSGQSLSHILDAHFQALEAAREFSQLAKLAQTFLVNEIKRRTKLLAKLQTDLAKHGIAEDHKRLGDLILAGIGTARRDGNRTTLIDYFDAQMPEITLEIDEHSSLPEAAEKFFKRFSKAKRADRELSGRIELLKNEIEEFESKKLQLAEITAQNNVTDLEQFIAATQISGIAKPLPKREKTSSKKNSEPEKIAGARHYLSSDGYEILVGRNSQDNDFLTLRVAKSLDWWLHAADYSGSHVVVRNKLRGELPPKTLLEAAQLAAKFSQAKDAGKVAVNYTQKKFVSKPKGAATGLVRLASFRTILVEPKEAGERILT